MSLTFNTFQLLSARRSRERWPGCSDWSVNDWCAALAGEVGELCGLAKRIRSGELDLEEARADLLREVADIITCADLIATALGAITGEILANKFDEVSARMGYNGPRMAPLWGAD
jgi:NTP pyrophosphatase (non-canonical NTP hydrolase)